MTDTYTARPRPILEMPPATISVAIGALLSAIVVLNLLHGFGMKDGTSLIADALSVLVLVLLAPQVGGSRHVFLALSILIAIYCLVYLPSPGSLLKPALDQASFIIAFFCALAGIIRERISSDFSQAVCST